MKSKRDLERFLLNFPANYKISLKAAIALAEWLLDFDKAAEQATGREEERGAGAFNTLRDNSKFRFSTASQRGVFYALLLAMYKPIKALKIVALIQRTKNALQTWFIIQAWKH